MKQAVRTSLLAALLALPPGARAAEAPIEPAKGHGVLDLAAPWALNVPAGAQALVAGQLPEEDARRILAARALDMDAPQQLRMLEDPAAAARAEKALVAQEGAAVRRDGGRLLLTPGAGRPVLFRDVKQPATKTADADGYTYLYAGRLGVGTLHRVEVSFEHDAPGSYLVSPADGRSLFVHEGSDLVVLSPRGDHLVTLNDLNTPITAVVASTAAGGPAIEILCRAKGEGKVDVALKGWSGPEALDLVVAKTAVRLRRAASGWMLETAGSAPLTCSVWPAAAPAR